jgi:acetolactate synthase-1/2/3 large subunit
MTKPIAKYAVIIKKPEEVKYELEKAYFLATSGRPGPVLLDIPMDVQKAELPAEVPEFTPPPLLKYELEKIPQCLKMLYQAKRPVILLGGGVWLAKALPEVKRLINKLDKVPVYVTWNMIDYYDPKHYCGRVGTFGGEGRNFGIQNSDFLLAIGSRISGRITGGMVDTFARVAKKVIVDVDSEELHYQEVKGDLNIVCDAKVFAEEMLKRLELKKLSSEDWWMERALTWKKRYGVVKPEYWKQKKQINPYVFVKVLSDLMKPGDVLIHEAGGNCVVTSQTFVAKANQRVFSNNGNSSLGYALPAAIGAAVATKKKVNCITGDGGLNFNIQEFQTLKHYQLPVKVLIFNNRAFGITKAYRDTNCQSEYAGVDKDHGLSCPDFIKVAKAYGLKAVRISNQKELKRKLKKILAANEPVVCDIEMAGFYEYQPKLGWRQPIEDQYPFLPRDEFRKNMIIEPHPSWENPQYP